MPAGNLVGVLDVPGYLRRLRLGAPLTPSVATLHEVLQAQVERIAYNTIDIHLGRRTTVDPVAAFTRIVETGRGGYCFHLNGALGLVLDELGFQVRRHRGGVCSRDGEVPLTPFANHLVLTVHGLPAPGNPGGAWLVDAGLGDALHAPLPLTAGDHPQGPFTFGLAPSPALPDGWRFTHDPIGSFRTMDFESRRASVTEFRGSHRHLSTSPHSPFVQCVIAQRRDATGFDKLIGCTLARVEASGTTQTEVASRSDWFAALADVFAITLDDATPAERDRLWQRTYDSHQAWRDRVS